jgi:hypothetical protein
MNPELLQTTEILILVLFNLLLIWMSQRNYKTPKHEHTAFLINNSQKYQTPLADYFYRCTVHFEDSLIITHHQMH